MGVPTASCFDQIVTPKTGKLSASHRKYAYRLIAERLLNEPTETLEGQKWMERGQELEPAAVHQYEFENDTTTEPVGFVTTEFMGMTIGASPDRIIVGPDRDHPKQGLEIKCPAPWTHIGYLLDGHDDAYRPQVQGQLWVCEFERVDFYSYHPRMPPALIQTARDEEYITMMQNAMDEFSDKLAAMLHRAQKLGVFQAFQHVATPVEQEYAAPLAVDGLATFLDELPEHLDTADAASDAAP
jgi:hypothetical protein